MEKIEAIIQPTRLEAVKAALVQVGVSGMTVTRVEGFGNQKGRKLNYRGSTYEASFVEKVKIETVVSSDMTDRVVEAIAAAARSGQIGDGKIFVSPVSRVVRIRTNERNDVALQAPVTSLN
jgi:nitrogen regulatory protein PII